MHADDSVAIDYALKRLRSDMFELANYRECFWHIWLILSSNRLKPTQICIVLSRKIISFCFLKGCLSEQFCIQASHCNFQNLAIQQYKRSVMSFNHVSAQVCIKSVLYLIDWLLQCTLQHMAALRKRLKGCLKCDRCDNNTSDHFCFPTFWIVGLWSENWSVFSSGNAGAVLAHLMLWLAHRYWDICISLEKKRSLF